MVPEMGSRGVFKGTSQKEARRTGGAHERRDEKFFHFLRSMVSDAEEIIRGKTEKRKVATRNCPTAKGGEGDKKKLSKYQNKAWNRGSKQLGCTPRSGKKFELGDAVLKNWRKEMEPEQRVEGRERLGNSTKAGEGSSGRKIKDRRGGRKE